MKKKWTRLLSVLLAVVLTLSVLPASVLAIGWQDLWNLWNPWTDTTEPAEDNADVVAAQAATDSDFIRIFHLDCGRQYFSAAEIKEWIALIAEKGYTHMELAIGNDGLRFLLDDMSIDSYSSDAVKAGIKQGNANFRDSGELSQTEMDDIIACAKQNGISIIPLLNSPGHMDAIIDCMESLGMSDVAFSYTTSSSWPWSSGTTKTSARTIDVSNTSAVDFTKKLIQKYVSYFKDKGCKYFNIGADEFANDILSGETGMGFGYLISNSKYSDYAAYVNAVAAIIKSAGMTPMAFNDGIYYNGNESASFDSSIVICYWTAGWSGYSPASASFLADKGHSIINTNDGWYYVLGNISSGNYNYDNALSKSASVNCKTTPSGYTAPIGCMQCIWVDNPGITNSDETARIKTLIETLSSANSDVFVKPEKNVLEIDSSSTEPKLDIGSTLTLTAAEPADWTVSQEGIVSLSPLTATRAASVSAANAVQVTALSKGNVVITATGVESGKVGTVALDVSDPNEVVTEPVTVAVNGTKKITVEGNYPGPYTVDPAGYATVTTSVNTIKGSTSYHAATPSAGDFYVSRSYTTSPSIKITLEDAGNGQYYLKNADGEYIYPSATRSSGKWRYALSYGKTAVSVTAGSTGRMTVSRSVTSNSHNTTAYLTLSNNSTFGSNKSSQSIYLYKENVQYDRDETTITFHGVAETPDGVTPTVTIGSTQYNITVQPASLANVDPLNVEYWITNRRVQKSSSDTTNSTSIAATASGVYSKTGARFSDLVLAEGVNAETKSRVIFWKGTRLTSDNKQTETGGDNKTGSGDNFTYIRYWDSKWSFSADGETWDDFNSDDQVIAYYMQPTTITDEVTTELVDWGEVPSTGYNSTNFVLLDFAVIRQSSDTRNPSNNFPYSGKTQAFHCVPNDAAVSQYGTGTAWSNYYRNLGMILAQPTEQYEVYMITVTPTSTSRTTQVAGNANTATSYSYNYAKDGEPNDEQVVWVDDEKNLGIFADESTHYTSISGKYGYTVGGDPVVPGLEIFNRHGMLITYYVRSISKTALNVHYREQGSTEDFYSYPISVKENTFFDPNFKQVNPGTTGKQSLVLTNNTVESYNGDSETVSADLSTMPQIDPSYRYASYTCVEVVRSDDGKDVYLYYTFDRNAYFVVDFGLPIEIQPKDVNKSLTGYNVTLSDVSVTDIAYGSVSYSGTTFTYTPNASFAGAAREALNVKYTGNISKDDGGTQDGSVTYRVYIIPASNVLYEQNFLKDNGEASTSTVARHPWTETKHSLGNQATQKLTDAQNFGYDAAYADVKTSAGAWTVSGLSASSDASTSLSTTFTGTGFDLIGSCGPNTGLVMLTIRNADGRPVRSVIVDTRYTAGTIDQVPLAHLDLTSLSATDAQYTAVVRAYSAPTTSAASTQSMMRMARAASYDALTAALNELDLSGVEVEYITIEDVLNAETASSAAAVYAAPAAVAAYALEDEAAVQADETGSSVTIDGFRVYRATSRSSYSSLPDEYNAKYVNILDAVNSEIVAYVDNNPDEITISVDAYEAAGGPQNEIYLKSGENKLVAFTLDGSKAANAVVQVSLRAVSDATTCNNSIELKSTTEMYYTLTADENGIVTIQNTGTGMLAIGNVKLPEGVSIKSPADTNSQLLLASVQRVLAAARPFEPATFDAKATSVRLFRSKVVTLRITVSKDVSYVTVNGKTYRPTGLFSRWVKNQTILVTDTIGRNDSKTYEIIAFDADGSASAPVTVIG